MGRVRRYKKLKACDPFAPKAKRELSPEREVPESDPNDADKVGYAPGRKLRRRWEQDVLRDEEHIATLMASQGAQKGDSRHTQAKKIGGKKEGESMYKFNKRVREESTKIMRDEARSSSTTHAKRKRYMEDKKQKKRAGPVKDDYDDSTLAGMMKAANDQAARRQTFGETNDAPPELPRMRRAQKLEDARREEESDTRLKMKSTRGDGASASAGRSGGRVSEMEQLRLNAVEAYKNLKRSNRHRANGN